MSLPFRPRTFLTSRARIRLGIAAVGVAVATGTIVFHALEGWSIVDSLYLTAQTVTTVGFGDLAPRTVPGRIFGSVFMMVSVGIVLYALTSMVQSIVQSEILLTFGQLRRSLKMSKLRDHFIICGAGRVGSHLVRATLEESLREAGVEHARGLAACLPDDADNVYVVLTARDLNSRMHIVARAAETADMLIAIGRAEALTKLNTLARERSVDGHRAHNQVKV